MIAAYLKMSGDAVKNFIWPVQDRDPLKNGSIALLAVEHSVTSPRDAASGMATGKRQHHPIAVIKAIDSTSPALTGLLVRNQEIATAEFLFFGSDERMSLGLGRESLLYKIVLKKAFLSGIEVTGRVDEQAKDGNRFALTERIAFVYDAIEWVWLSPDVRSEDIFSSKG